MDWFLYDKELRHERVKHASKMFSNQDGLELDRLLKRDSHKSQKFQTQSITEGIYKYTTDLSHNTSGTFSKSLHSDILEKQFNLIFKVISGKCGVSHKPKTY